MPFEVNRLLLCGVTVFVDWVTASVKEFGVFVDDVSRSNFPVCSSVCLLSVAFLVDDVVDGYRNGVLFLVTFVCFFDDIMKDGAGFVDFEAMSDDSTKKLHHSRAFLIGRTSVVFDEVAVRLDESVNFVSKFSSTVKDVNVVVYSNHVITS